MWLPAVRGNVLPHSMSFETFVKPPTILHDVNKQSGKTETLVTSTRPHSLNLSAIRTCSAMLSTLPKFKMCFWRTDPFSSQHDDHTRISFIHYNLEQLFLNFFGHRGCAPLPNPIKKHSSEYRLKQNKIHVVTTACKFFMRWMCSMK
jgi:hypothetical protein